MQKKLNGKCSYFRIFSFPFWCTLILMRLIMELFTRWLFFAVMLLIKNLDSRMLNNGLIIMYQIFMGQFEAATFFTNKKGTEKLLSNFTFELRKKYRIKKNLFRSSGLTRNLDRITERPCTKTKKTFIFYVWLMPSTHNFTFSCSIFLKNLWYRLLLLNPTDYLFWKWVYLGCRNKVQLMWWMYADRRSIKYYLLKRTILDG